MNKGFIIESTESTPLCMIPEGEKSMLLSGVSMPENASEFYFPLISVIDTYFEGDGGDFNLVVNLTYMNSMSNKQILRLMKHIENKSFKLNVDWKYNEGDDLMKAKGEELQRICKTINFKIFKN